MENKINKNTIPNDFSIKLVLIDALPVLFFGLSGIFLGLILNNFLFYIGATICMLSGILKVLWKFIVAKKRKISGHYFCRLELQHQLVLLLL